ncbi:CMGC family protein kinase [Trichomonas vaginalis G3]|uniref:non-specific serine/threonine protein kinase n=1 Tax=Trichomonas vaginalis (strain ATCC PRA-98 / G3) TaxID=412133 RepID=A2DEV5_TRIV3|nr:STKc CK2 alpha domain-containing protein [Trichomonas vaginalis G3]EAY20947.1 CMGC family protein kinase [Trichomonas vaginalis G3]KAI5519106.1 STKc CK2 alpha domain-containing protein [Trichomonas vaginalis G3]|eukprot:XP_001581933.1 CMGC family protein kinase [Trichomonas vaginalis G3]
MSRDRNGILISVSSVYADVNQTRGPSWYDHKNFEPTWNSPENYALIKKVGRGKYSIVFKAIHNRRTECAIKILVPLDPKRYNREIKILTNLKGERNILQLYDLIKDPVTGVYSFVSEWVEFYDWRSLYSSFSIDDIRLYMYKLIDALDTSHSHGIMHRDIKPQNIAIDKEHHRLRLLDWGLADFYHPKQAYNSHVATRVFKPPELLFAYPYYDYSMDIWSAGLTLSIMMFKRIPIECGEDDTEQLLKVAELVGGKGIIEYADSLGMKLEESTKNALLKKRGTGWQKHVAKASPDLCPPDAVDLLQRMTAIDHRQRVTAHDALKHPFFKPLFK